MACLFRNCGHYLQHKVVYLRHTGSKAYASCCDQRPTKAFQFPELGVCQSKYYWVGTGML